MSLSGMSNYAFQLSKDICTYLDHLIQDHHLLITVHRLDPSLTDCWHFFLPYNNHSSSYCAIVKTNPDAWKHCIDCQLRVLDKCRTAGRYVGMCWAGGVEVIYPVYNLENEVNAFLSVSGFRASVEEALPRLRKVSDKYDIKLDALKNAYLHLNPQEPDLKRLDKLMMPLQHMLTLLVEFYRKYGLPTAADNSTGAQLYIKVLHYINRNYAEPLSLEVLSKHFQCSYSTISHLFAQYNHGSFSQYLSRLRVENAQKYRQYTDMTITQIASMVGIPDPNYFSSVFRKIVGCSPQSWRKNCGTKNRES